MPTVGDTVIQARAPNRRPGPSSKSDGDSPLQGSSARVAVNQADLEHSLVVVFWLGLCATPRQGRALPGIVPGVSELAIVPTPFFVFQRQCAGTSEPHVCKCAALPTHPPYIPYLHEPETVLHQRHSCHSLRAGSRKQRPGPALDRQ